LQIFHRVEMSGLAIKTMETSKTDRVKTSPKVCGNLAICPLYCITVTIQLLQDDSRPVFFEKIFEFILKDLLFQIFRKMALKNSKKNT
jgi:hypothetical protein